jgi:hypothetical protein
MVVTAIVQSFPFTGWRCVIDLISRYNLFDNVKKIGAIPETQKCAIKSIFGSKSKS